MSRKLATPAATPPAHPSQAAGASLMRRGESAGPGDQQVHLASPGGESNVFFQERNVITQDDWRLQGQDWLREELLRFQQYAPPRPGSEHDHCEFCWVPFRTGEIPGTAKEGYVTQDQRWICETCYEDFKLMFEWILET